MSVYWYVCVSVWQNALKILTATPVIQSAVGTSIIV